MFRIPYAKTIASCAALATAMVLATLVLTHTGPAKPRPAPRPQLDDATTNEAIREAIKPGNYATAINVHNPSPVYPVTIYAKAVQDGGKPLPFPYKEFTLQPDFAREVDCTDIYAFLDLTTPEYINTKFTKGFVVLFASGPTSVAAAPLLPLDVVGVYTAEPPSVQIPPPATPGSNQTQIPGIALEMLTIAPRLEFVPPNIQGAQAPLPSGRYYEYAAKFLCGNLPIPLT
jgi:hypothetical protein